jgi:ABC-type multidrug transport system ATPase subunit
MRQKLDMASTMIQNAPTLLLDELTAGLDPKASVVTASHIKSIFSIHEITAQKATFVRQISVE